MSIRRLYLLFTLFIPCIIFAQVKYFEVKPMPAPPQIQLYVDHPDCGVLVVYSSLRGLSFDSNMAGIQEQRHIPLESKYVIYLRPIRQKIVVKSPGFIEIDQWGPGTPKAKEVAGYFTVEERNPDPDKVSIFSVTFKVTPPDATLKVDNREYDVSKPVMLKPGAYRLEVSKPGYVTQSKQIEVSAERAFFEVNLKAQELLTLTIRSTPPDAEITLDSVAEGRTPRQLFRFPGSYRLRLAKTGHETIEEDIIVSDSGDNTFNFNLAKATVSLNLSLDPPDATLRINNEEVSGNSFELAPGQYKLEARKSGYDPVEKMIVLQRGTGSTESLKLTRQTGRLLLTVDPIDANLSLSDGTKWSGARILPLPVGDYRVNATLRGYQALERSFKIEKGKDTTLDLQMQMLGGAVKKQEKPISEDLRTQQNRWKRHQTYSLVSLVATLGVSAFMYSRADAAYDDYKAADNPADALAARKHFLETRDQYYLCAGVNLIPLTYASYSIIKRQIIRSRIKGESK